VGQDDESERVYAAVDETACATATDRRLLIVVPTAVGIHTESVPLARIESVAASQRAPTELLVEHTDGRLQFNARTAENPRDLAAFLRRGARGSSESGTDGTDGSWPDPATTDGGSHHAGGGRSVEPDAGYRTTDQSGAEPARDRTDGAGEFEWDRDREGRSESDQHPQDGTESNSTAVQEDTASSGDPLARLERLAALHERGVLDESEFEQTKRELLDDL
jgi:hypothetical protein